MFLPFLLAIVLPVVEVSTHPDVRASVFPGRVTPIARVDVVPQVSGEILEVAFINGAAVKAGDVLYRLDPVKYEAAVKNAESKLAECKANAQYAELSYDRHKNLLETRAVSLDAVDNALSQRDASRAALAAAQAELVAARDDLKHCTITAPISGMVGSTTKTRGNYVTTGSQVLVTIVQLDPIRVKFSISNRELLDLFSEERSRCFDGVSVALTLANGSPLKDEGSIEYVENQSDESTDTLAVYALFKNPLVRLVPGGTVSVSVSSRKGVRRTAIPPTAVLQDTQGPYVWVVGKDDLAERRSIARGSAVDDVLFIEKGLVPGERIVADGAHKVRRGMKIEAAKK